jgi:hypothetical protein
VAGDDANDTRSTPVSMLTKKRHTVPRVFADTLVTRQRMRKLIPAYSLSQLKTLSPFELTHARLRRPRSQSSPPRPHATIAHPLPLTDVNRRFELMHEGTSIRSVVVY